MQVATKRIRARAIRAYMDEAEIHRCVVFSCGSAARALVDELGSHRVLSIARGMDLDAQRWFSQAEIARNWPTSFDGTSGHLPWSIMNTIALEMRELYRDLVEDRVLYDVPTGSGESVVCMRMAFPNATFQAVYDDRDPATTFEPRAPLVALVRAGGPVKLIPRTSAFEAVA